MTTDTAAENTASQHVKPYRHIVAFTLLAAVGLQLVITLVNLFLLEGSFRDRAASLGMVDVATVGLPVVAVLLATHVAPVLKQGKAITLVALAELGIVGLLVLLSFAMGLMQQLDGITARGLVVFLLASLIRFALLGIAIFFVVRVFTGEYLTSAAQAPQFGYPQQQYAGQQYPQQQYGHGVAPATDPQTAGAAATHAAYAQQAAYQQQAQPGYGQYGYPQQAQQQAAQPAQQQAQQQTGYQTPATYGQSAAPTSASPASSPPTSAAPASSQPTSASPAYGYGQQQAAPQQQEAPQATAWPPAPPSTSQWPPTPAPRQQQQTEASSEDVQHTQMLRPETFRGNSQG